MKNLIRGLASGKRRRLKAKGKGDHKYNLDLAYVGNRVIAMGLPAEGAARRCSAEHLIATKALRLHSYGPDAHCR